MLVGRLASVKEVNIIFLLAKQPIKAPSILATMSKQQATKLPVASTLLLVWTGLKITTDVRLRLRDELLFAVSNELSRSCDC